MAVQASCSQKALVLQLRKIARDPKQCEALVRNPRCLESLVQTLDSPDDDTRLITIQTFLMICKLPVGLHNTRKLVNLRPKLTLLQDSPQLQIANFCKTLYATLYPQQMNPTPSAQFQSPQRVNQTMPHSHGVHHSHPRASQQFHKRPASGAKNKSWQKNKRIRKEAQALLEVKLEVEPLDPKNQKRLKMVGLKHESVVQVTYSQPESSFFSQQNIDIDNLVSHLREENFEVKAPRHNRKSNTLQPKSRNQMQRYNANKEKGKRSETLTERLARQRAEKEQAKKAEEQESKQAEGWLTGAASYFW